jgi:hypothetical protein
MQIALHVGAHCTDDDRILRCLLKNQSDIESQGIVIPNPASYRNVLRQLLHTLPSDPPNADQGDALVEQLLPAHQDFPKRIVFSDEHFFGPPRHAIAGGLFYTSALEIMDNFSNMFPEDEIELFIGISNPAIMILDLLKKSQAGHIDEILNNSNPLALQWSELIERLASTFPEVKITVWQNEDTPLLWGLLIRAIAGLRLDQKIKGAFDMLSEVITVEGMQRFRDYLRTHPNLNEPQKRRVMGAFLARFANDAEVGADLAIPGWTQELVDDITEFYAEDLALISRIPDVQVLRP